MLIFTAIQQPCVCKPSFRHHLLFPRHGPSFFFLSVLLIFCPFSQPLPFSFSQSLAPSLFPIFFSFSLDCILATAVSIKRRWEGLEHCCQGYQYFLLPLEVTWGDHGTIMCWDRPFPRPFGLSYHLKILSLPSVSKSDRCHHHVKSYSLAQMSR